MWKDSKKVPLREFSTPPSRTCKSAPCSPMEPVEKKRSPYSSRADSFHAIHKVPTGDSPYVKAKHVQLIDKDPNKAISLFWSAINSGDRVDSALKDMAIVMKQLNRSDEAIEAIKSFRHLCSHQAQESLDNVLIDLYKRGGRIEEHIELLQHKLKLIEEGLAFGGKRTKIARSQGKKFHVSIEQERSRILGNLAWAYMQQNSYQTAEELYRKALSIELDKNKQCNLAICLMHRGRTMEAKSLLQTVIPSSAERDIADSYIKSFDRAFEMLTEIESQSDLNPNEQKEEMKIETWTSFTSSPINISSEAQISSINGDQNHGFGFAVYRRCEDRSKEPLLLEESSNNSTEKWKKERGNQFDNEAYFSGFEKGRWSSETGIEDACACKNTNYNGDPFGLPVSINGDSKLTFVDQRNGWQSSQQPLFVDKWKKGSHSEYPAKKGSDFSSGFRKGTWVSETGSEGSASKNMNSVGDPFGYPVSINGNSKFTSTEPSGSRFSANGDWRRRTWGDDAEKKQAVTQGSSNAKILIESPITVENLRIVSGSISENVRRYTQEAHNVAVSVTGNSKQAQDFSISNSEKSWADMVEEEEQQFLSGCTDFTTDKWEYPSQEISVSFQTPSKLVNGWNKGETFHDENLNSNIICSTPPRPPSTTTTRSLSGLPSQTRPLPQNHIENLRWKLDAVDLKEGYTRSTNSYWSRNTTARRSLSFNREQKRDPTDYYCPSPLPKKAFNFEDYNCVPSIGSGSTCEKDSKPVRRGNRLQVFQDITLPDSPRV